MTLSFLNAGALFLKMIQELYLDVAIYPIKLSTDTDQFISENSCPYINAESPLEGGFCSVHIYARYGSKTIPFL